MYRSGFEAVCDFIANLQGGLSERLQWVFTAICLGLACTVLVGTLMAA